MARMRVRFARAFLKRSGPLFMLLDPYCTCNVSSFKSLGSMSVRISAQTALEGTHGWKKAQLQSIEQRRDL